MVYRYTAAKKWQSFGEDTRRAAKKSKKMKVFFKKVLQNHKRCAIINKHGQGGIAQLVRAHGSHP